MNENRINLAISAADKTAIEPALDTLKTLLSPMLIALNPDDKKSLAKMKDKSLPFVEKALQYADTNPEFVPAYLDIGEADKDLAAFKVLNEFLRSLQQMVSNLEDTSTLAGSEAYQAALAYYASVGSAVKLNVPNAQAIYDDLSVRFKQQKAEPVKPPQPE
jgi:hypothetical protein